MESSLGEGAGLINDHAGDETAVKAPKTFAAGVMSGLSVHEPSFPAWVAAFLRFSPVIEAAQGFAPLAPAVSYLRNISSFEETGVREWATPWS